MVQILLRVTTLLAIVACVVCDDEYGVINRRYGRIKPRTEIIAGGGITLNLHNNVNNVRNKTVDSHALTEKYEQGQYNTQPQLDRL